LTLALAGYSLLASGIEPNGSGMRRFSVYNPASSLSGAADVLAGFVIAAPALPQFDRAMLIVPLLFASVFLLRAAGSVFEACFGVAAERVEVGRASKHTTAIATSIANGLIGLKGTFVTGCVFALAGIFAALGAAVTAGKLPAYFAAFVFLTVWARSGRGVEYAVGGPLSAGLMRALGLAMGMSAHPEFLYFTGRTPAIALGLYFAYGALTEAIVHSEGEGGRRYALVGATFGLLGIFGAGAVLLMDTSLSFIVTVVGATFVAARAWPALTSLMPGSVRKLGEGAMIASGFLGAAIVFGNPAWRTDGSVLPLGSAALVAVIVTGILAQRYEGAARGGERGLAA
jgi:hypothetical protein